MGAKMEPTSLKNQPKNRSQSVTKILQKSTKKYSNSSPKKSKIEAWAALGAYRGVLVASGGFLGVSWGVLGASWGVLGASWEASWARLGVSWGCPEGL